MRAEFSLVATRLGMVVAEFAASAPFSIEAEVARSELSALKSSMAYARREEGPDALRGHLRTALAHAFETMSWVEGAAGKAAVDSPPPGRDDRQTAPSA